MDWNWNTETAEIGRTYECLVVMQRNQDVRREFLKLDNKRGWRVLRSSMLRPYVVAYRSADPEPSDIARALEAVR